MAEGKDGYQSLVEWLNTMLPYLNLPLDASEEELRLCLMDGTVLCNLLSLLNHDSISMGSSYERASTKVERFLRAMDEMALPRFEVSDIEQGDMVPVLHSLEALKASFSNGEFDRNSIRSKRRWSLPVGDTSEGLPKGVETNFHEVSYANISDSRIAELMKPSHLQNASTQSLLSMLKTILNESTERLNGSISHGVASLLRTIVQFIEQRISVLAGNLKNQNILFRVREGKYQSRIKVLETLAAGTTEETEIVANRLEHIKLEKAKVEEREKLEELDVQRLKKETDVRDNEISKLMQELEVANMMHEKQLFELKTRANENKVGLEKKLKEVELRLTDSRKKVKELENFCESKSKKWERKASTYQNFVDSHSGLLQELKVASESIKQEVVQTRKRYNQDINNLGLKLRGLVDAAKNYHTVLEENRRLYNEVQDLKGNIRVYCRIRPFLAGQSKKLTIIDYIGESGELVVANPSKQGKDTHKLFKFNKVFDPSATQEQVFLDTRPLVRSVLDGYNVCIFAYGQTGSGKTYTMSGPSISAKEDWGVNYRALNDLFQMSQSRHNSIAYEVGVQMVEIYNEQVRDLLSSSGPQRRLGIWNTAQPNGLAVPDASMHYVKTTEDVLELMHIGLTNRAVGATALNERSSRSHSILTVHVRGTDLETDSVLRGSLHLVDLAGSERVDRSEATGDRLKEAQHINKSLSALGDVIFALAQKSSHVPYRNSKLTQVLQGSLGGQAKTLMFVQINPDVGSYSETISTLKFAERVSGVELGAAKSNKEGRDVRQLMEQVSSLKDTVFKRDEEIERLKLLKDNAGILTHSLSSLRYESLSPRRHSIGPSSQVQRKDLGSSGTAGCKVDNGSRLHDKHSDAGSQKSSDEFRHHQDLSDDIKLVGLEGSDSEDRLSDISDSCLSMKTGTDGSISSLVELTLFPETVQPLEKAERSQNSRKAEESEKPEKAQRDENADKSKHKEKNSVPSKLLKPTQKPVQPRPSRLSMSTASSSKALSSAKRTQIGSSSSIKPLNRRR